MARIYILGVGISKITFKEALKLIKERLDHSNNQKPFFITTPNPEMLVLASSDNEFKEILNQSDLAIPDGVGLVWADRFLNLAYGIRHTVYSFIEKTVRRKPYAVNRTPYAAQFPERILGTDFMLSLCEMASQEGYTVGLLGAGKGVAQKTEEVLKEKFPGLKITFAVKEISDLSNLSHLSNLKIDLLFVAFGAPKQEKLLYEVKGKRYKVKSINFKVGMGVGGAFDQISGKIPRAPGLLRTIGFEWLWRLLLEPKRIGRILNATVVFPWLLFWSVLIPPKQNK